MQKTSVCRHRPMQKDISLNASLVITVYSMFCRDETCENARAVVSMVFSSRHVGMILS